MASPATGPSDPGEGTLTPQLPCIHRCFGGQPDVPHILQALAQARDCGSILTLSAALVYNGAALAW